ncbi:hypothetical protein [Prochlorococcus marinus]|uniref:hypothetical protein n=1 Tax=Prochlorococcus marinus TaxID=1219 RepID=UPI0002F87E76|nr:hypothetical protein [Prochlorococcus marinus]
MDNLNAPSLEVLVSTIFFAPSLAEDCQSKTLASLTGFPNTETLPEKLDALPVMLETSQEASKTDSEPSNAPPRMGKEMGFIATDRSVGSSSCST